MPDFTWSFRLQAEGKCGMSLGAVYRDGITSFRVWAPELTSIDVVLEGAPRRRPVADTPHAERHRDAAGVTVLDAEIATGSPTREIRKLDREERGYWGAGFSDVPPGTLYRYQLDGDEGRVFPDPASRFQPHGVHGPSEVIDPGAFRWTDEAWRTPDLDRLVIYELHVGTFSQSGTFHGVRERLPYLAELGVTAIELLPLGDFPGERNWGYDGVALFAPARCYGRPDDLRHLVDAAHQLGLAVILDVVYNHLGPDGAYANAFSPYYFTDAHRSPWGSGVNLDRRHSGEVRRFFLENALHWIAEYHVDGLRLDATHALQDDGQPHFLQELSSTVRTCAGDGILLVAEDHRNLTTLVQPAAAGGMGLDAVWADDFHHQARVHTAHDREGYYHDYSGTVADLALTLQQGWFFTGQVSSHLGEPRGTDPSPLLPRQFVICIQNHDQIGNRAYGTRLNHDIESAAYRALSALLLMAPETPLLFMGQEWAASTPFLFFTDHHDELGHLVTQGRREEFRAFAAFADPEQRERIPDPQAFETFRRSRLDWSERDQPPQAGMFHLYRRLLALRRDSPFPARRTRQSYEARALDDHALAVSLHDAQAEPLLVIVQLSASGTAVAGVEGTASRLLLTTEDEDVVEDPHSISFAVSSPSGTPPGRFARVTFERPGAVIVRGLRLAPPSTNSV